MLQTLRINLIALLTLLQLLAPLLHAHGGGVSVSDRLHLPGLEFLTAQNPGLSAPTADQPCLGEFIVGVAQGCEDQADRNHWSADTALFPHEPRLAAPLATLTAFQAQAPPPPDHPRPGFSQAIPRAPPEHLS